MKILLTGCAGFIGARTTELFIEAQLPLMKVLNRLLAEGAVARMVWDWGDKKSMVAKDSVGWIVRDYRRL